MSTTNPVYQVLVTSGNQAPLAAGTIANLAVGQIGVFNYHTGEVITPTSDIGAVQDFFIAVGVNRSGTTALEDINKSAGQYIQSRNVNAYMLRRYGAPLPKIVDITDFTAKCDTEYGLKIEFRNQNIYSQNGYNMFAKTWQAVSGCCEGNCVDCETTASGTDVATKLILDINADPDNLVLAQYLDYTTTPGTPVVVEPEDVADWVAANPEQNLGIRLTSIAEKIDNYGLLHLTYYNPRGTDMIVTVNEGFLCNHTITTFQELAYEEGNGYDINQLEYVAGGWNGKPGPYRVSTVTNYIRKGFEYFAQPGTKYAQLTLGYDLESQSNFEKYQNNLQTIIAIPCGELTATLTPLVATLDRILNTRFAPMAGAGNALAAAIADGCDGDTRTEDLSAAASGIKFLA